MSVLKHEHDDSVWCLCRGTELMYVVASWCDVCINL